MWCMLVHITNKQPVHVIPGSRLDLKAWIKTEPQEEISMVTWEREPETGFDPVMVTLATCSGSSMKCAGTRPNVRVNMEQQETTLQINGYSRADSGEYSVIVTAVHHVSVSINVSHSSLVCGEAWGTDPSFSWLHERAVITQTVGRVSRDGTTLFVTMSPICGHFTCVVSNKLGHSSDTYAA
uniref:Si:dkeyp-97a10.2 n=1 Tax=Kryptolebias marmoratus TaxID=37003 RepID=A0A3Q3GT46_KRYMA